jgi:RNA polymerase sigma-70 factor (ECF subfamily)
MLAVSMGSPQVVRPELQFLGFSAEAEALRPVVRAVAAAVLRAGRTHPDVEDCTNETLRRALEGRDRLRAGEPVRPWLIGIARHVALDMLRARQRDLRRIAQPPADAPDDSPLERVPDSSPGADERLSRARELARVKRAMSSLPDDHRRALELFHVEGLAYREISERLGVPVGTVCTWISRARRAVASALETEGT